MQTTLPASIGASSRTSASGHDRPVKVGVPNGCSAVSRGTVPLGSSRGATMRAGTARSGIRHLSLVIAYTLGAAGRCYSIANPHDQVWKHNQMAREPNPTRQLGSGARWSIMAISLGVTASSFLFINGVAFLIPALQLRRGISLTEASLLSSM